MVLFSAVILVDPAGRILLQERDEHAPIDPDRWGLVGGHLDPGEEHEPAAYRELAEETGVRAAPGSLEFWDEIEVPRDTLDVIRVYTAATDLTDADIVVGEGRQIVFVPPGLARELPHTRSAAIAVPAFLDSERYRELCS